MNNRKRKKIINRLQTKLRGRRPALVAFSIVDLSNVMASPISRLSKAIKIGADEMVRQHTALFASIKKMKIKRSHIE